MGDVERDRWPLWARYWILPYLEDTALWPVLMAVLGHVVVLIVPLLVFAQRSGHPVAYLFLAALGFVSVQLVWVEVQALRRPGALTGVVVVTWGVSIPLASYTGQLGIF